MHAHRAIAENLFTIYYQIINPLYIYLQPVTVKSWLCFLKSTATRIAGGC
jgi:hypothetical protein